MKDEVWIFKENTPSFIFDKVIQVLDSLDQDDQLVFKATGTVLVIGDFEDLKETVKEYLESIIDKERTSTNEKAMDV